MWGQAVPCEDPQLWPNLQTLKNGEGSVCSEGSSNLTPISAKTSVDIWIRINFFPHEFRTPTMRASSRLHGALLSRPTSWPMTPRTCHPLHSSPVTTAWMSEVRASPPPTAAALERSLAKWSSAVPKSCGETTVGSVVGRRAPSLCGIWQSPQGLHRASQARQNRRLPWGSSWSRENTAPWLFYF